MTTFRRVKGERARGQRLRRWGERTASSLDGITIPLLPDPRKKNNRGNIFPELLHNAARNQEISGKTVREGKDRGRDKSELHTSIIEHLLDAFGKFLIEASFHVKLEF